MIDVKIRPVGMFHTPSDWEELQDWIERHSVDERAHLYTAAVMAWNMASLAVNGADLHAQLTAPAIVRRKATAS